MAVAKIYNSQTGQWEAVIVGATGDTGVVQSDTEPSNTDQLWLDTDDTAEPLAIPAGGSAGQILQKSTDGDYDTAWSNVPSHNYIINGAFDIWQRGDGPFTENNDFLADRWKLRWGGTTPAVSATKETFTAGEIEAIGFGDAKNYIRFNISSPGDIRLETNIEDVRTLAGQTVTLSFYARSADMTLENCLFIQKFAGGSGDVVSVTGSIPVTSSWQRFSKTITLPSVSGKTINEGSYVNLRLDTAQDKTGTIDFWGVQLEAGSIATPFKRNANSIQGELAACQRYYYNFFYENSAANRAISYANAQQTGFARTNIVLPTQMRATPSLDAIAGDFLLGYSNQANSGAVTALDIVTATSNNAFLGITCSGLTTDKDYYFYRPGTTARLGFQAEL